MGRMKKAEREHFLAIAKEQLAEYDLTIDDLTKEDLSDLIEELRDREAGHVVLDGFFPIYATQMKWRKELELKKAKERLANSSCSAEENS
jgi:hypothetical protein